MSREPNKTTLVEHLREADLDAPETVDSTPVLEIETPEAPVGPSATELVLAAAVQAAGRGEKVGGVLAGVGSSEVRKYLSKLLKEYGGLEDADLKDLVKAGFTKLAVTAENESTQLKALEDIAGLPGVALSPAYVKINVTNKNLVMSPESMKILESLDETEPK